MGIDMLCSILGKAPEFGLLMGYNWLDKRIVTVDMLGQQFLDTVKTGQSVRVTEDGTVEIENVRSVSMSPRRIPMQFVYQGPGG